MVNTEKPTGKQEQKKQMPAIVPKKVDFKQPLPKQENKKEVKSEQKKEDKEETSSNVVDDIKKQKKGSKIDAKKKVPEKPKAKKTEATINVENLHLSTKQCAAICKFIKYKKIPQAIRALEEVSKLKKPVPMKGELPHQKGIMSGKYPAKAAKEFIILLKSLASNAEANELNEPVIKEAIANIGARPYGRFGRMRRKRTHVFIKAVEKKIIKQKKKETSKK